MVFDHFLHSFCAFLIAHSAHFGGGWCSRSAHRARTIHGGISRVFSPRCKVSKLIAHFSSPLNLPIVMQGAQKAANGHACALSMSFRAVPFFFVLRGGMSKSLVWVHFLIRVRRAPQNPPGQPPAWEVFFTFLPTGVLYFGKKMKKKLNKKF